MWRDISCSCPPPASSVLSVAGGKRLGLGPESGNGFGLSGEPAGAVPGRREQSLRQSLAGAVILYGLLMNSIL